MSNNFVHLHAHSTFSLLDGIIQPKDLAKKAKAIGQPAVAITDHGSLAGWIKFYRACKAENIKPILGCEIYMDFTEEFSWLKKMNHLTVLCKNNIGYTNLIKLHNLSTIKHGFKRVRVTYRELSEHRAGLIILSGCPNSIFAKMLENDKDPEEMFLRFQRDFGDDFYVELMNHGLDIEKRLSPKIKNYAQKLGIKTVATNDTHYLKPEDAEPQYVAMLDAMKKSLGQPDLPEKFPSEFYLKTREQMVGFEEHELDCTIEIANKCNVTIEKYPNTIPDLDFDIDTSLIYPLEKLPKKYKARYDYEYEIIKEANLISYFKVVCDFLDFANKNDIFYGLGRGSIGGSLYAFLHGIHKVNPLRYDLYFSRFYNHGRKGGMPDIDTDFSKDGINDMYKYIKSKYGESNVVHIGISGKAGVKGALKMVCRTLGIDFQTSNNYSKMVPDKPENIYDILQNVDAKKLYDTDPRFKKIVDITSRVEGINFSYGTHASGIIISSIDLMDKVPLHNEDVELYVSYWDMEDCEWLGFLKFDFLTIDTLDIIKKTLKMIGRHTYDYIIHDIDPEVFKFIHNDSHVGLFQITSSGISQLTRAMKPDSIMELSHVVALYRPGPLCLSGDVKIFCSSYKDKNNKTVNKLIPIKDLYEAYEKHGLKKRKIRTLDDKLGLCDGKIKQVLKSGIKPVYSVKIQAQLTNNYKIGNRPQRNTDFIKCSKDHMFLTNYGWKRLCDLKYGDYVAIYARGHWGASRKISENTIKGRKNFRNICFRYYEHKCIFCDWDKGSLDVNHIYKNRYEDNSPENLCFVCPNHHREITENKITTEQIISARDKYKLPVTKDITFVKFIESNLIGDEETYDIEMYHPYCCFIASDFVVHNSSNVDKSYVDRKFGYEPITPIHPLLAPILKNNYQLMIYQEDVIKICIEIGGFSEVDADVIRKIIGKKKADEKELIQKMKEKFLHGAMEKGLSPEIADKLWSDMEAHSGYSFNRAHSVEYGYITYITAYLKMKHPAEFMAACLSMSKNELEIAKYLNECKRLGIKVSPPDIKKSKNDFTVNNGVILFALNSIKNTGDNFLAKILEWQSKGNLTLDSLILYVKPNKRVLESLIRSGALDCFVEDGMSINEHRGKLLYNLVQTNQLEGMQYTGDLFGETVSNMWEPLSDKDIMYDEKIFLGAFITNNPMDSLSAELSRYYQLELNEVPSFKINLAGIVDKITKKLDKNGNEFAIINIIQYNNVPINLISYSRSWAEIGNQIKVNNIIGVSGRIRDAGNFIIDKLITVME